MFRIGKRNIFVLSMICYQVRISFNFERCCRGHDHLVVGFTTTYAISARLTRCN